LPHRCFTEITIAFERESNMTETLRTHKYLHLVRLLSLDRMMKLIGRLGMVKRNGRVLVPA
jgi:hypothetical protein